MGWMTAKHISSFDPHMFHSYKMVQISASRINPDLQKLLLWLFDFLTPHFFVKVTSSFQLRHFSRVSFNAESPSWPGESAGGFRAQKNQLLQVSKLLMMISSENILSNTLGTITVWEIQIKLASIKEQRLFNTAETVSVLVDKTWRKKKNHLGESEPVKTGVLVWNTYGKNMQKHTCCYEFCQCKF